MTEAGTFPPDDDEDEATLAAIDEGILDAKAGRAAPAEEVGKLLPMDLPLGIGLNPKPER